MGTPGQFKTSRNWSRLFLIVLLAMGLITPAIPMAKAQIESIVQIIDDYENEDYIAIKEKTIRNPTLNAMELNTSSVKDRYEYEGCFYTINLLSVRHMLPSTLITNSELDQGLLTVQFSNNNYTWVDHNNQPGYDSLIGDTEILDLSDLNFESLYMRFNFTRGGFFKTPRLYQIILIGDNPGGDGPGNGYGDSPALGQFVDDYENTDNVSVAYQVVNNITLNCMELYYSTGINKTVVYEPLQLKEHKHYAAFTPGVTWALHADYVRMSSSTGGLGRAFYFFVVDREWIDGKYFRWRWAHSLYSSATAEIYDGSYSRSSATDFPSGAPFLIKGNGLLQSLDTCGITIKTSDVLVDVSGGSEDNVTIFIYHTDSWNSQSLRTDLYWLQINEASGGTDNLLEWVFQSAVSTLTMEQTGTANDYGKMTGGGVSDYEISMGGYNENGWFNTTELLSGINGNSLVLMTNSTLNGGTLTVEFSPDGSTWTLNDWDPIFGGYESIDLRDINSPTMYLRYNFTRGGLELTPRLFQTRLISTEGPILNVTGAWIDYNVSQILNVTGIHDSGTLASLHDIDGDVWNCSEVVGAPGYILSFNFTGVDPDAGCLWLTMYVYYDGNQAHDIDIELWNFTSTSWADLGHIDDDVGFEWHNASIYDLRIPNDFVNSSGAVLGRLNHVAAGNINHDIHIEYLKLQAFIPFEEEAPPGVGVAVDDYSIIFLAMGLIFCLAIYFLYARNK